MALNIVPLVQVMASTIGHQLSHYLHQCRCIANWNFQNKLQWNIKWNIYFHFRKCIITPIILLTVDYKDYGKDPEHYTEVRVDIPGLKKKFAQSVAVNAEIKLEVKER